MAIPLLLLKKIAKSSGKANAASRFTRTARQERASRNRQIQIDISIIGDKKLQRDLRKLPNTLQKKIGRRALRAGARIVGTEAQAKAPRDSGDLAESLIYKPGKRSRVRISQHAIFGVSLIRYYAAAIELGARLRRPFTFLRDAADQTAPRVLDTVQAEIGTEIDKAMRK